MEVYIDMLLSNIEGVFVCLRVALKSITNSSIPQRADDREGKSCCSMFGTTHSNNRCGRDPRTEGRICLGESCCLGEEHSSKLGKAPHFPFHPQ